VTAKRIETAHKGSVRANTATFGIKKDTGATVFPVKNCSAVMGVTLDKGICGEAEIGGKTCDFVRVNLNSLVAAARETLLA
jgi:hypothetical protein